MMRTAALACFLLAGPATATEEAKATEKAAKSAAGEEASETAQAPTPSLRGKGKHHGKNSGENSQSTGWMHYKFSTVATKGGTTSDSVQMAEIYFYVSGTKAVASGITASDPMGNSPQEQGAMKAVDNDITTKWLDFQKQPLEISYPAPIVADAFSFVTGDDFDERDPMSFTMEVSTDKKTWTLVSEVTNFEQAARSTETKHFEMNSADPGGGGGGGGGGSDGGCGGGCAFLIAFFGGSFVYFAAGFAYNFQRKELRGVEAIPQVGFWKDFPFLVKDGALFIVYKVTGRGGYASV